MFYLGMNVLHFVVRLRYADTSALVYLQTRFTSVNTKARQSELLLPQDHLLDGFTSSVNVPQTQNNIIQG